MAQLRALATHQPAWVDERGNRVLGEDEDVATLAVDVGRTALGLCDLDIDRVVVVTQRPDYLTGPLAEVVAHGLGLPADTPVAERLGGAPAVLDELTRPSTATVLVVAVSPDAPAGAGAVVVAPSDDVDGHALGGAEVARRSVPVEVHAVGQSTPQVYDDPRLLRDRGWATAVAALARDDAEVLVVGPPVRATRRLSTIGDLDPIPVTGAAAAVFGLAALLSRASRSRLVAVQNGAAAAVDVDPAQVPMTAVARPAVPRGTTTRRPGDIPLSVAAYERAFEAKVGLLGQRCGCGHLHHPPRVNCPACGAFDDAVLEPLPRQAIVYSVVAVQVPVPAKASPYALAVVDLEDSGVRLLTHVTDAQPDGVAIGSAGTLVLRKVADRQGIPDYGYAFQPAEEVSA